MSDMKYFSIEIDPELHYKLHQIAKDEERSDRGQILYLIRQYIKEFEKIDGEIKVPSEREQSDEK